MQPIRIQTNEDSGSRKGVALVIVLVVVTLLTLAAYSFSEMMIVENSAAEYAASAARARSYASSGIDYVLAQLQILDDPTVRENLYHDPARFSSVAVQPGLSMSNSGRFSLVSPVEADINAKLIRFGLVDESAKLNLNTIAKWKLSDDELHLALSYIPGLGNEIIDCILDWIDADDNQRAQGAELTYYSTLTPPYRPKNARIESLDELLVVKGVSASDLYGEDANRNGLLDPNENDGDLSYPSDNADGVLDLGWSAYLTVHSREANLQSTGTQRINIASGGAADIYDLIQPTMGTEVATFVAAYLLNGPSNATGTTSGTPSAGSSGQGGNSGGGGPSGGSQGGGSNGNGSGGGTGGGNSGNQGGGNSGGGNSAGGNNSVTKGAEDLAKALLGNPSGAVTRNGIDFSATPKGKITSLFDLVDAQVTVVMNGASTVLESPFRSDASSLQSTFAQAVDILSTYSGPTIDGRVNVNQARYETLLAVPGMTTNIAQAIVSAQLETVAKQANVKFSERSTIAWLLSRQLVTLAEIRKLDQYLTARGDVFRVQSVGHFDRAGPIVRLEAVIDASQKPVSIVSHRDLSDLGPGYPLSRLLPQTTK